MNEDGDEEARDVQTRAWMHRQNIQRYRSLLRSPANRESHDQVRKLLEEEEAKLRSLSSK
ncbi:hypothetical protein [Sphingobium sp.]|uniref:hypothetical protein n=1 Tax=Sphingobium sp. TaxID=1912891 RepID=UPI000DB66444|nr:hypothetical protein [Sphingobium sp.]PZU64031.1 MAG: hypothetical protein DI540_21855 [Sphingobium sp.]